MQNLSGFIFPHPDTPKSLPGFRRKPSAQNIFGAYAFAPLHGYVQNPSGFIFPHTDTPKTHPDFTLPNRETPKTHPVLHPNRRRETFRGVCFCAPTRVRAKFGRFHISAPGCAKNAPRFTHPNKDTPKTRSILGLDRRRGTFRGVCNTPLHGYVKNPADFRPKFSARGFWRRMQYAPTRIRAKFVRFHISASEYAKNAPDFRRKSLPQDISGRMLLRPTRIHPKPALF